MSTDTESPGATPISFLVKVSSLKVQKENLALGVF